MTAREATHAHPVSKVLGTAPTLVTHRSKATQREQALARGPKAGRAVGPLAGRTEELSRLSHLTGHGCARQRGRKQEARTVSQELNVFRKWPRREEGNVCSESSKQKPGHWPGSCCRRELDSSKEWLRGHPPWVWRSSGSGPAPVQLQGQTLVRPGLGQSVVDGLGEAEPRTSGGGGRGKRKPRISPRSHGKLAAGCLPRGWICPKFILVQTRGS